MLKLSIQPVTVINRVFLFFLMGIPDPAHRLLKLKGRSAEGSKKQETTWLVEAVKVGRSDYKLCLETYAEGSVMRKGTEHTENGSRCDVSEGGAMPKMGRLQTDTAAVSAAPGTKCR